LEYHHQSEYPLQTLWYLFESDFFFDPVQMSGRRGKINFERHNTINYSMSKAAIAYLALGSNLGDRLANLKTAIAAISPAVTVLAVSPVYETPPWGMTDQPAFLNMVLRSETHLAPLTLLAYLKHLETQLGRLPSVHYGPRLIDMDILFYDDLVMNTPELTIPHPHLHERAFVLVPLADLAAEFIHPVFGKPVRQILAAVDTKGVKRYE
jgi:2-amino-4-hydroxy-6-hydroxymethyldihydropteridine diphosphokinase